MIYIFVRLPMTRDGGRSTTIIFLLDRIILVVVILHVRKLLGAGSR